MPSRSETVTGLLVAMQAFLIWGLSPLYWNHISHIPAFETLMHRVVWSLVFLVPILVFQKKMRAFYDALTHLRTLAVLTLTTCLVGTNWFIFIWSINHGHVMQTSLGYYINPLVTVFLGMIFLKERLTGKQKAAVLIAGTGVLWLTLDYGTLPWVSLALAFSFAFYSLIRKVVDVGPLVGLTLETLLLSIPAVAYLGTLEARGHGAFLHMSVSTDLLLMGTALITALPLLLFNLGAKALPLSTLGFIQYLAPTCTFLLAVFYFDEPLDPSLIRTFVLIWTALALVTWDSIVRFRTHNETLSTPEST
ncbi:EamA family transporter RarD [Desulfoluna sp.]|uniref:EamA family transporter RarD n=1 Tax=Desulfoluna sp. TaxID=2045199 RepID=UPI00262EBBE0|nr:EamA family transporter RarD [Desulfoluna sp.]